MRIAFVGALKPVLEKYCTHWTGIEAAFKRLPHEYMLFCCRFEQDFEEHIIQYQPDVIIYNLIDMAKNEQARLKIRHALPNAKIVFWYGDCRTEGTGQIKTDLRGTVDLFLVSNNGLKEFQKESFGLEPHFMPLAAEPTPTPLYSERAYNYFLFIGGKYVKAGFEDRYDMIDDLEKYYGLTRINGQTPEDKAKIYRAMPLFYGSATFTLDVSHFWHIPGYTSNRFWVIPANWGFPLTKRFPDHELLVPETHHVYWDTLEELTTKMEFYRKHPEERKKMIIKGWEYAKQHHTYEQRINAILAML